VAGLKHHAHSALTQSPFQLVAGVEYGFAKKRLRCGIAVLRTMVDFVRETAPTGWAFFHLLVHYTAELRQEGFRNSKPQKWQSQVDSNGCSGEQATDKMLCR
jgi:hypothetical protein